jgi:hypothetical protein
MSIGVNSIEIDSSFAFDSYVSAPTANANTHSHTPIIEEGKREKEKL